MTAATVQRTPTDIHYGNCFSSVPGLPAGAPVRICAGDAVIYCTLAWDLGNRFDRPGRVALDRWQCEALGVDHEDTAEVDPIEPQLVPAADAVELSVLRWSGTPGEHRTGLVEFLRNGRYLLYPGLRFTYRPLGGRDTSEYRIESVHAGGAAVGVATVGPHLTTAVRRPQGVADWPPTYDDVGGHDEAIALLRREVELPLRRPADLAAIGVDAPPGVLLYGPPGTGKTLLARAVSHHSGVPFTLVSGSELAGRQPQEAETVLRAAFAMEGDTGRIVVIDDIDYLAPDRSVPRMNGALLSILQRLLDEHRRPVVIATTSRRDDIDPGIRRLGRLGRQIAVGAPGESDRRAILMVHTRDLALGFGEQERAELVTDLARRTAGFVGADLEALCHEAGRVALRRAFPADVLESANPVPQAPLQIQRDDWEEALTLVTPSAIGSLVSEIPPTTFADVAGLPDTVAELTERLILPLSRPHVFAAAGLRMERGVLLYGPPGTGKTLLARAIAHECGARFMSVRGPELLTKWFGESEQAVRDLFERARSVAPCVIFFDEIEAIARRRTGGETDSGAADRVVNQLLAEIDGLVDLGQVCIIGATNNPAGIDEAILRPGRLGLHIEVPLPDQAGREALFRMYLDSDELRERCAEYAAMTPGSSGADIAMIAREARLAALRRVGFDYAEPVRDEDVLAGIRRPGRAPALSYV
ncbi:AAA family ATPase [Dactylosporangium sp. CA-139066]|uniref:AAA family ATPase n=1 Tax=Dactylosporangium sp. CA-139066 TaxID=3239930 RepID=UPI003D92E47E